MRDVKELERLADELASLSEEERARLLANVANRLSERASEKSAAEVFRRLGPWEGESEKDLLARLAEARRAGGSAEPPSL